MEATIIGAIESIGFGVVELSFVISIDQGPSRCGPKDANRGLLPLPIPAPSIPKRYTIKPNP